MLAGQWEGFSRLKEDAMKRNIGLVLATGLALLIAGCSSQSTSGGNSGGGGGASGSASDRRSGDNC